jgi:hypothetical protein
MAQPNGNNMDVDKINVRVAFGPPIQDTLNAPYKLGELRTRPADGLWYRYNGNPPGTRRWDYVYFGPVRSIIPTLDQVLNMGNVSSLPLTAGIGTFSGLRVPTLAAVGQVLMVVVQPDGTIGAQTIPGGGTLINSINGLTANVQFIKTSFNVATSPQVISATATHTLNLPIASASPADTGVVTPAQVTLWNGKANFAAGGTSLKYWRGDSTWAVFPTIPAQGNFTYSGGGITITGTWPNLNFDVSSTGTLTGLTGDVVTTGTGAAAATIQNNVVSYAKMQQVAANKLLGNPTGSTDNVSEISLNTGTGLGFSSNQLKIDTVSTIATIYDVSLKVNLSDTSNMLSKYLRKTDTVTLSNRINTKVDGRGNGVANLAAMWTDANTIATMPLTYTASQLQPGTIINFLSTVTRTADIFSGINDANQNMGYFIGGTSTKAQFFVNKFEITNSTGIIVQRLFNQAVVGTQLDPTSNAGASIIQLQTASAQGDAAIQFSQASGALSFTVGMTAKFDGIGSYTIALDTNNYTFAHSHELFRMTLAGDARYLGNGYIMLPGGTTGQRPSTATASMMRWNIDSSAYEFYNGSIWRVFGTGSGGGTSAGALLIANNLSDLNNTTTARNNLGLGALATLGTINNTNWSGTVLSAQNGGTGLNNAAAGNGKLLIGTGTGFALNPLTITTPGVLLLTNGSGTISLGLDTNALVTKSYLLSNPSTIAIIRAGTGFGTIYSAGGGTQIYNKTINPSTFIGITQGVDSALTISSLYTFPMSVVTSSTAVQLQNDNATPGNYAIYQTNGSGTKGWQLFSNEPVTTNTTNGLFSSAYKKRVDSGIVIMNAPVSIAALGYDSIAIASATLDTLYHKVFNVQGTANRVTISKGGSSVYVNAYTFDIASTYVGQTSITTVGTIATGVWHGSAIATTYGGVPTGGASGYILSKNSSADYDLAWIPAPTGGSGGTGLVNNVGAGYRLVQNGVSANIKTLFAGSGLAMDSTTNTNGITLTIPSLVTSITGTTNQITASAATGPVTLSIPSLLSIQNITASGTIINSGITYQAPNNKLDVLVVDTTTGTYYKQRYYYIDTTGYAGGATYLTFDGTKVVMNTTTSSSVSAYTILGNNTNASAAPTFFSPVLASALFRNQGTTTQVLHGNASGNPTWGQIALLTDVTGTLATANGGTSNSSYTVGDILYASATTTLAKLGGNTTTAVKLLSSTGTGSVAQAPAWYTPTPSDLNTWATFTIESQANKSTSTSLGTSNTLYPSQNAVKVYVDGAISGLSTAYFPLAGGSLTGTSGAGYIGFISQASAPGTPASGVRMYASSGTSFSFKGTGGLITTIAAGGSGTYTLPDLSGSSDNLVTLAAAQTLTNKTFTSPQFNFGTNGVGDIYYRNSSGVTAALPIGSNGQQLTVSGGLPVWQTPSGAVSGSYTPTLTGTTNISSISLNNAYYMQIGNIVHVRLCVTIQTTTTNTDSRITYSLPFTTSITGQTGIGTGVENVNANGAGGYQPGVANINGSSTQGIFDFKSGTLNTSSPTVIDFTYSL